jgi:hypothetical protein
MDLDKGYKASHLGFYNPTRYGIPIRNIGLGAAREIHATWVYDRAKLQSYVEEIISQSPGKFTIEHIEHDYLITKPQDSVLMIVSTRGELHRNLDFILSSPSTIQAISSYFQDLL